MGGGGRGGQGRRGRECGVGATQCLVATRMAHDQLINSSNFEARGSIHPHARAVAAEARRQGNTPEPSNQWPQPKRSCLRGGTQVFFVSFPTATRSMKKHKRDTTRRGHTDLLHSSPDHTGSEQEQQAKLNMMKREHFGPWKHVCCVLVHRFCA